jgi:hypothetical protein
VKKGEGALMGDEYAKDLLMLSVMINCPRLSSLIRVTNIGMNICMRAITLSMLKEQIQ